MSRKIAPSQRKAQELTQWLHGQHVGRDDGQELLRTLVRLATARVRQAAVEHEHTEPLGRDRDERRDTPRGYRNGYEEGTGQRAAGVLRLPLPQVRGRREPSRSKLWSALGRTSDVLSTLLVEMSAGGMSQRDIEAALEKALGQFVISTSALREITARLAHE